jgi:putative RecB family exonuclease
VTDARPWTSPSRLKTFLECPRRYDFAHVQKLPTLPSPNLDLGNNVHAALRDWLRMPPAGRTWDALLEFYRAAWRKNRAAFARRSRDELREWGERGIVMLRSFAAATPADLEPLAIEKWVGAEYDGVSVRGRVDRIDALPDGSLVVIDYKTGKFPRDVKRTKDEDLAAPVYARGAREAFAGTPVARVELLYLATMERVVFAVDDAWQAHKDLAVATLAARVEEATAEGAFPAQPSGLCKTCDFRARCPEGKAYLDALVADR